MSSSEHARSNASPPQATPRDSEIRRAIVERLGAVGRCIEINVESGNVYLSGRVGTKFEGQYLAHVIQQMSGVRVVRANFQIGSRQEKRERTFDWSLIPWKPLMSCVAVVALIVGGMNLLPSRSSSSEMLVPASVLVRVEDSPAAGAMLTLHPLQTLRDPSGNDLSGLRPRGVVQPDGRVEWTTWNRGDGIPAGQYVVTAVWLPPVSGENDETPSQNKLPLLFSNPSQSPLRLLIHADNDQVVSHTLNIDPRQSPPLM